MGHMSKELVTLREGESEQFFCVFAITSRTSMSVSCSFCISVNNVKKIFKLDDREYEKNRNSVFTLPNTETDKNVPYKIV